MFVGSDYTEGIENVGIVKTVEIFQEFEGDGVEKLKNFKYTIYKRSLVFKTRK